MSDTRTEQFSTLAQVSRAVASILDLDTLLDEVVTIIRRTFDYPSVHLYTVDPVRQQITFKAGSGPHSPHFDGSDQERAQTYDLNSPEGIIPWVARHGQTVVANNGEVANNLALDARYRPPDLDHAVQTPDTATVSDTTESELTVPLVFRDEVLGVLDIQSERQDAFSEQDRFLFEALADSVAIAIRNANLYRSERWRRQVADSLHQVAGLLSADVMLEEVLDTVLAELERTLPCDLAAVWLLEDDELHLPAVRGPAARGTRVPSPADRDGQAERTALELPSDKLPLDSSSVDSLPVDSLSPAIVPDPGTWLGQALDAEGPIIRSPISASSPDRANAPSAETGDQAPLSAPDPLAEALGFPANHSAIAAPLRAGSQRLGLLTLCHREPGRYGAESEVILTTFASYAAVAIENARLFQEAQEQALISTVMLQVAKVSQSFDALDQVLGAVAKLTAQLVGVSRCALVLWDQPNLVFVPGAAWGLDPTQESLFRGTYLSPGEVPALDDLLITGAPAVLNAVDETGPWLTEIGFESLLILPLLSQGSVQGAMLIECPDDFFIGSGSDESSLPAEHTMSALLDQRLVILQGIAYQAATAIENAQLREVQEAEAYVSAALLQVSQAVSNLHSLDEILATIVRITPILIGTEQCLLFLWDDRTGTFCLTEAYGLSQEQQGMLVHQAYAPDDFRLLDSVRTQNKPLSCPLSENERSEQQLPDGWMEHIRRENPNVRSLLAIPLAVKDELLGVMLLAEPQGASDGLRSHYSREKRLEIISGIAHQAALTVQNHRLQQARVSSQRLERELELAREIQHSFIPDGHLVDQVDSGWDIAVEWRAARHVAGDFYDLIELPGRRLGLIVADVADKGMPAALLMALTRTLLRATALEESSPATVLARVNNLLVPDAKRGMFVTAAYAVLCQETGQLTYANAGHCLPLHQTYTGQLCSLPKGGMALGVIAGVHFEEHSTELAPGDRLVFYSDGVTEAFSPQGELYGESRLLQVLQNNTDCSAQSVLNAILESVHTFTDNAPPADDLTVLILRRDGRSRQ